MGSVKEKFIKEFGKHNAQIIENCALEHGNGINNKEKGDDPFKNSLLIVIGYECISRKSFFDYHKFDSKMISPFRFEKWCKEHGELDKYIGDCDYLALMAGIYNKFMPDKSVDLMLTSPPYNTGNKSLGYHPNSKTCDNFYNEYLDNKSP